MLHRMRYYRVVNELIESGDPRAKIGGMAINIHGFTRNTEDIDLLIETEETNERKILEVLSL